MLLALFHAEALDYGIAAKKSPGQKSKLLKFAVFGERCSGTNYTSSLFDQNTFLEFQSWGHKHFPPWFDLPQDCWRGPQHLYTYQGSGSHLFIIVIRNPYDWVRSLRRLPWHAHEMLWNLPLSEFLRTPWFINPKDPEVQELRRQNLLMDKDPETGANFENVLQLRTAKIKNMLMILERAKNVYVVRYETLRDHPKEVLREVSEIFGIKLKPFEPVTSYKGHSGWAAYQPRKYCPFTQEDIDFIRVNLDEDLESFLGYQLVCDPAEVH